MTDWTAASSSFAAKCSTASTTLPNRFIASPISWCLPSSMRSTPGSKIAWISVAMVIPGPPSGKPSADGRGFVSRDRAGRNPLIRPGTCGRIHAAVLQLTALQRSSISSRHIAKLPDRPLSGLDRCRCDVLHLETCFGLTRTLADDFEQLTG